MWHKKIILTDHVKFRFIQRHINFSKKENNVARQILHDLRPLNVMAKTRLRNNDYKVVTNQGKVYIITEEKSICRVKTVYKSDIQYKMIVEHLSKKEIKDRNENNQYSKNNR